MKATIMIPDELYRSVKAKSAMLGLTVREVTVDLFRKWVTEDEIREGDESSPKDWVAGWLRHRIPAEQPGPTAREILEQDRGRLDSKTSAGEAKVPGRKLRPRKARRAHR
jgi:hypothetical protein